MICLAIFIKSNTIQLYSKTSFILVNIVFTLEKRELLTDDYDFIYHYRLDGNGDVDRISYSNQVRDSFMTTLAPEKVKPFYKALLLMNKLLYDNAINYKLNAGMFAAQTITNIVLLLSYNNIS